MTSTQQTLLESRVENTNIFQKEEVNVPQKMGFQPHCYTDYCVYIDGKERHFTRLNRFPESKNTCKKEYSIDLLRALEKTFIKSGKKYSYDPDCIENPFELLEWMDNHDQKFNANMLCVSELEGGFNVRGNFNTYSKVFNYRFYCIEAFEAWINQAKSLDPNQDYSVKNDSYIF